MKTIDDALAFADTFDKPANKHMSIVMLAAEVRRLRECLSKANASAEHFEREWYLRGDEIERMRAEYTAPECQTCANRGLINGLSQETYCDSCLWYGAALKKNNYRPMQEPAP